MSDQVSLTRNKVEEFEQLMKHGYSLGSIVFLGRNT